MQTDFLFSVSLMLLIVFVIGCIVLTGFNAAILKIGKFQSKETLKSSYFFFKRLFFKSWDKFYLLVSYTKHILYLLYASSAFLFLFLLFPNVEIQNSWYIIIFALMIIFVFLLFDFTTRLISNFKTRVTLKILAAISSFFILIFVPFTFLFYLVSFAIFKGIKEDKLKKPIKAKDTVIEMIKDSDLSEALSSQDKNMIASLITFKEKVAREIMIPRVDIFSLDAKTTIKQAAEELLEEDYSRIPVYLDNMDNIIGILMYKDLLKIYFKSFNSKEILDQSIETIIKPIIYTPENKKISKVFQEFKSKKMHLAIVVNEYGGTEGIVTIEDILEEMVGEIEDEYDIGEEKQFFKLPSGGYIIDAKMSIIDLEENLKIKIPHSVEYETIGGYIFHIAGTIPTKGWKIHLEDFEIEVLISNDRCIEKIKITPTDINS